jgi:LysR family transcriptional activator of dmlA
MNGFSDLAFFTLLAKQASLAAAAQELGITPPAVSKRLALLERRLGVRLLNRTTRRASLTPEGEMYLTEGARVLEELETLERSVSGSRATPTGIVRVSATLGFGRRHMAPALSNFARRYPEVEVQMHLSDRPVNLVEQGFDVLVRFGEVPDARLTARSLALNRRLLCASPEYLAQAGQPGTARDLAQHPCLFIRESDETFGTWHLQNGTRHETVKVRGPLSTNDGESALAWALDGHGILMRSQWDLADSIRAGKLVAVLPAWRLAPADVYLVFQSKHNVSVKTRALVDFLLAAFAKYRVKGDAALGPW